MASKAATLELAVLGLLQESPLHGYELRKRLNLLLGRTRLLSYGSLYPALKRMLRAGLVEEVKASPTAVSRRSRLQERLDRARSSRGLGTDRYVSELQRHSIESVEREVRWLTDLIAAERTAQERPAKTTSRQQPDQLPIQQPDVK